MGEKSFYTEIITPEGRFYGGDIESLIVKTSEGFEGFLPGHSWCCKLLAEKGEAKLRPVGDAEGFDILLKGGYIDVADHTIIYADKAAWKDEEQKKYYENI